MNEETLRAISHINAVWVKNNNDEDGDKYLSDAHLAMEAVSFVLDGVENGIVRQFMEAEA